MNNNPNCWAGYDGCNCANLPATQPSREEQYGAMVEAASAEAETVIPSINTITDAIPSTRKAPVVRNMLVEDDATRGDYPMFDGLMAYFPNALAEVSKVSKIGNDQHNPGQPMHWARDKSTDHGNKIMRHLVDAGGVDPRGVRHTARLAWRALAMLQEEIELADGLPPSRASTNRLF